MKTIQPLLFILIVFTSPLALFSAEKVDYGNLSQQKLKEVLKNASPIQITYRSGNSENKMYSHWVRIIQDIIKQEYGLSLDYKHDEKFGQNRLIIRLGNKDYFYHEIDLETLKNAMDIKVAINTIAQKMAIIALIRQGNAQQFVAYDRFFDANNYHNFYNKSYIELNKMAPEASFKFDKILRDRGIVSSHATRAILSGEIAIHPLDLQLVLRSFGRPPPEEIMEIPGAVQNLIDNGWLDRSTPADVTLYDIENVREYHIFGIIRAHRQEMFNAKYGGLGTALGAKTIIDGEYRELTQDDIDKSINGRHYAICAAEFISRTHTTENDYTELRRRAYANALGIEDNQTKIQKLLDQLKN